MVVDDGGEVWHGQRNGEWWWSMVWVVNRSWWRTNCGGGGLDSEQIVVEVVWVVISGPMWW